MNRQCTDCTLCFLLDTLTGLVGSFGLDRVGYIASLFDGLNLTVDELGWTGS